MQVKTNKVVLGAAPPWHPARRVSLAADKIRVGIIGANAGLDHGVGHPLLLLCNANVPNY